MIDEKAPQHPPPAYGQPPQGAGYNPSQGPAGYPSPQPYPQTPQPYPHTEGSNSYGMPGAQSPQPMGTPGSGPQPGYPPPQMPSQMGPPPQSQGPQLTAGAAYQQQRERRVVQPCGDVRNADQTSASVRVVRGGQPRLRDEARYRRHHLRDLVLPLWFDMSLVSNSAQRRSRPGAVHGRRACVSPLMMALTAPACSTDVEKRCVRCGVRGSG